MNHNSQVRVWLFKLLARLEEEEVTEASLSDFENFGQNYELKIRFGDKLSDNNEVCHYCGNQWVRNKEHSMNHALKVHETHQ
jgi:hypothetical protein